MIFLMISIITFSNLIFAGPLLDTPPEPPEELEELGEIYGFEPGEIIGWGVELTKSEDIIMIEFIDMYSGVFLKSENYISSVQSFSKEIAYIIIDPSTKIIGADFRTQFWEMEINLGNRTVKIPPKTRIYYDGETIDLTVIDGSKLKDFDWDLIRYFNDFGKPIYIEGESIEISEDLNINGKIEIVPEGYVIEEGVAIYKNNFLKVEEEENFILIAKGDADLSNYEGNWIKQTERKLEIKSSETGNIKMTFVEGHEILNTDPKDELILEISKGDSLNIVKRVEEGLIPKIDHVSSLNGETKIYNGKIKLSYDKKGVSISPSKGLSEEDIAYKDYQSVAMEISSNSENTNQNIRINSYRQYMLVSDEDKEIVTYNQFDLPISNKIQDNLLQTVEQLREKYPTINFTVPQDQGTEKINPYYGNHVPPYLLYVTDQFLQQTPQSLEVLEEIQLVDKFNAAAAEGNILIIGRQIVDPNEGKLTDPGIREQNKPLQTFTHEYEHIKDQNIINKEQETIRLGATPYLKELYSKYDLLEEEIKNLRDERIFFLDTGDTSNSSILLEQIEKKKIEIVPIQIKIEEEFYKRSPTLQQKYNELVVNAKEKFSEKEDEIRDRLKIFSEKTNEDYIDKALNKIIIETYGEDEDRFTFYQNTYGYSLKEAEEEGVGNSLIIESLKKNKDLSEATKEKLFYLDNLDLAFNWLETPPEETDKIDFYWKFYNAYKLIQENPNLKNVRNGFDQLARNYGGLFYSYTARNYDPEDVNTAASADYNEFSSTFMEQPLELKKRWLEGGIRPTREMYQKATQLAFDSNKMSVEDYKYLMGENHCKKSNCSDQLCVEYKLMCCIDNPDVPNCK